MAGRVMSPAISCVIPVYNGEQYLSRAVGSVLKQRDDVQIVLVDDCSSDGSKDLALEMSRKDQRVTAILLPQNRGQAYARNVGVAAAHAPYVTFLDQDDEHAPGWYDHAIGVLESSPQYAAVRGDIDLMDVPAELSIARDDLRRQAMANSTIWNMVMRKPVYQVLGGCPMSQTFRTREGAEDVALVMALNRHFNVARTRNVASKHFVRPGGATAYFLKRSRVVGSRVEFTELSEAERSGSLERELAEFQTRAGANVEEFRELLAAKSGGFREVMAGFSMKMLKKIAGN
jgi:glycosyltransferase involved in cell wall biosynthesis